jgi:hypothetical protein
MSQFAVEESEPNQSRRPSGTASASERYLSLALTGLLFVIALLPRVFPAFREAVGISLFGLLVVLALRSTRLGYTGSWLAAWMSVAILSLVVIISLVIVCVELLGVLVGVRP